MQSRGRVRRTCKRAPVRGASPPPASRRPWLALTLALLTGCATTHDFRDPAERLTEQTVYTLRPGEVRLDAGLLGSRDHELGLELGLAVGLPARIQLEMNVAHGALGLLNLQGKWNFYEHEVVGLGAAVGISWSNPQLLWVIDFFDEDLRGDLSGINIVSVPLGLAADTHPLDWLDLQLGVLYVHSEIFGDLQMSSLALEGGLGTRGVELEPLVRFYLAGIVALDLAATIPVWAEARIAASAEYEIEPGVRAGVQTAGWADLPVGDLIGVHLGAEVQLGVTHVRLQLDHGALARILDWPFTPSIQLYWRI